MNPAGTASGHNVTGYSVFSVVPAGAGPWRAGAVSRFGEANRIHARQLVSVRVTADTLIIETGTDDIRTVSRTTTQPIRNLKAQRSRKAANVS